MKEDRDRMAVRFTRKQVQQLKKEKEKTGNTVSSIIRQAVNEYFEKKGDKK